MNWKKRSNVESKKAQKRNAKNYETDIIIAGSIETLGYFYVGHKQKESHRLIRFLTEVASDPGLEPGALRLGGARSYPTELIRHLFYCTLIDRKINDLKLLEQKKFSNPKDSQRIENPAETTPR